MRHERGYGRRVGNVLLDRGRVKERFGRVEEVLLRYGFKLATSAGQQLSKLTDLRGLIRSISTLSTR